MVVLAPLQRLPKARTVSRSRPGCGLVEQPRDVVTAAAFGFFLEETSDGLEYWHQPMGVDLRAVPREERGAFLRRRQEKLLEWLGDDE